MLRIPLTIWRQALGEMLRLFVLTTVVLVTIVSFALTVKFFAEGRLGPLETLHFMVLAMVPMLQYTVPFAACFAATLVYHRMASDNEVTAALAGGVSYRAILAPALLSGLLLAGGMSMLSEQVVPRFLWSMENLVSQKVAKLVMSSIQKRQPLQQGGMMVYADEVVAVEGPAAGGAPDAMVLFGVVVVRYGDAGVVDFEAAARQALVQVYPGERARDGAEESEGARGSTLVVVSLKDAAGKVDGKRFSGDVSRAFTVSGGVEDDPKFLTWGGLRALREHPDRLDYMDRLRRELAYHFGERAVCDAVRAALRSEGRATLVGAGGDVFVIEGRDIVYGPSDRPGGVDRWALEPGPSGLVRVDRYSAGPSGVRATGAVTRMEARTGGLATDMGEPGQTRLTVTLQLEDVASSAGGDGVTGERADQAFTGLSLDEDPMPALLSRSWDDLLAEGTRRTEGPSGDAFLKPPTENLRRHVDRLNREVTSKQHERMAMSAAGLVMVLTGAISALRLRGRLPLTVYLWSFFPALATVLTISSGQQMVEPLGDAGLILLWAGVAALAVYSIWAYRVVSRH